MFKKAGGLLVAEKVLTALNRIKLPKRVAKNSWIGCFDNCREQGYVISFWDLHGTTNVAFTENRNSDDIVVYVYDKTSHPSNLPDEKGWENRHFFPWKEYDKAAAFIAETFRKDAAESEALFKKNHAKCCDAKKYGYEHHSKECAKAEVHS